MTNRRFEPATTKLRRGGGVGEVRKKLPLLLANIRRTGQLQNAAFVIVLDNDRSLTHPSHQREAHHRKNAPCRQCELRHAVDTQLSDGWPIAGAIAVPVEMIEAWLLLLCDRKKYPLESDLPRCARKEKPAAVELYGSTPPPQLKDLVDIERTLAGKDRREFVLGCVLALDVEDLATRSPSFALFADYVRSWSLGSAAPQSSP